MLRTLGVDDLGNHYYPPRRPSQKDHMPTRLWCSSESVKTLVHRTNLKKVLKKHKRHVDALGLSAG